MFGSLGWGEIAMLLVVALLVFGPDKLPSVVRDAAQMLRQLRRMAQGAREQISSELGPEFADFDLESLNPKTFVRKHLLEDDELDGTERAHRWPAVDQRAEPSTPPREAGPAPYDPDAT